MGRGFWPQPRVTAGSLPAAAPGRPLRERSSTRPPRRLAIAASGCALLAAASLTIVPAAPGYDAWSWLIWGRELASLELSTTAGPAFKPLPVAACALLAFFGDAAPELWVWLTRAAALLGVALAAALAWQLSGASRLAAGAGAVGVAFAGGYLGLAAGGGSEGLLVALALLAILAARRRAPRAALLWGVGCGLLRVETWPFLVVGAALAWRRQAVDRRLLVFAVALVPALWFVPEWLGSGDPLRSAARARVPNGGQPALADVPALASLGAAAALTVVPVVAGVAGLLTARGPGASVARLITAAGGVWIASVAAMSQAGFSGEGRYSLLGVALVTVGGGVGLGAVAERLRSRGRRRAVALVLGSLVALAAIPRVAELPAAGAELGYRARLSAQLGSAVQAIGGRRAVLRCGRPYVGHLRGPLLAWHLGVPKRQIAFEPRRPGVLFRSRLSAREPVTPPRERGFRQAFATAGWQVDLACRRRQGSA
jgi:hypothetical protein